MSVDVKNAEGYKAWLKYDLVTSQENIREISRWCSRIVHLVDTRIVQAAKEELTRAISIMIGEEPQIASETVTSNHIRLATSEQLNVDEFPEIRKINEEGYLIKTVKHEEGSYILLAGKSDKGVLYATFHLLRLIQAEHSLDNLDIVESPRNQIRMINQWDNMDGSVERGYAGESIFYKDDDFIRDYDRIKDYARLLSSVGINAISINNVNVHAVETSLITTFLPDVAKVADVFRTYGITTYLSANYASPMELGDLTTADPLDEGVKAWWKDKVKEVYSYISDFGGFVVKADSEHRPGPFTYGRNHADGSNMLAEALEPFGGIVIWRCFVYNCMQDWRDRSTDRARAAYDHFKPLDGQFHNNVILQIKNGPMDFQVREPVSPLFGAMRDTNQMIEFQVAQEYTGQQRHVCFLIPQWKEILDFDTYAKGQGSTVKSIVDGSMYESKLSGIAAVSNIGNDTNWCGHQLAQANLFGYGRLIWDPNLSNEDIVDEWARATFGNNSAVIENISAMLLSSWQIYESYTAPLGVGWMVNPNHHYGPNVDGYEYSVWGTYHFADWQGIGVDRTVTSGTGYTSQYFEENMKYYESLKTCPDELLLFFHHVPYTHLLKSGETVIQHIYNTHFEGVDQAIALKEKWEALQQAIDEERFHSVNERLEEQIENAKEWRDMINTYFYRKSGIKDKENRVIY
ncbi:alpha-glucuronidase family glycosyl hydrolase [Bacillus suaedae]|uniref:Xylan alpha-1,2-glucuronidase n=1 Tax=Halalkalibacter suaedae TaxID=2822140 RepID=A0A940WYS7_9BACI|nr:alpha-glucuronidase family glycosyl hydrolase [Bacillus suaedae]MBP3951006.1 alpha-glucuronidase [Bacillus suaedae]